VEQDEAVAQAMPILHARGIRKQFGTLVAVKDVDLDVHRGEVLVILGPSGSGKSTLLRCLNQLEAIDAGAIYVDGELVGMRRTAGGRLYRLSSREIARQRSQIGFVAQNFNLFPRMTVLQNVVEGPLGVLGQPRAEVVSARGRSSGA
jgi:polar amino acid transport system ATP-binding protein